MRDAVTFEELVLRLVDRVDEHPETSSDDAREIATADEVASLVKHLGRQLGREFAALGSSELEDVADEAVVKFVAAVSAGRVKRESNPIGYLFTTARNTALSRLRRRARRSSVFVSATRDDEIASMLDARASKELVQFAMAEALRASDLSTARIIRIWLDLAEETDSAPSARAVGRRAGASHTAVLMALSRFKSYFPIEESQA